MNVLLPNLKMQAAIGQMCLIMFLRRLNTTYLILSTTYSVNFNKQNSKRHLFKSKLEIPYLLLQTPSDYFQV